MSSDNAAQGGDEQAARAASRLSWQEALGRHLAALSTDELDALRGNAIRGLDRATRARPLDLSELARLSALADYLAPRVEKRAGGDPPTIEQAIMFGLIAGYQLAVGDQAPQEPDPFAR